MSELLFYLAVGFVAQFIDGALGMAYGVSASSLLLARGIAPAVVSATVHTAEVFTTGVSAVSHHYFGNVDRRLFIRLALPGVFGAILGAYVLSQVPGERFRPYIATYLLAMGFLIVIRALWTLPPKRDVKHVEPLGFFGAFVDAVGGGGWGPVVTSTLVAQGNDTRFTVGSVNAAEFLVTVAASITFLLTVDLSHWPVILGLALGGMIAAPVAAFTCKKIPHRPFMFLVGLLVIFLSLRTIIKAFF
jgi:uncharacterized membrane protein YfcA